MADQGDGKGLRIRRLLLAGSILRERNYGVSFLDEHGNVRPLSVIAGPSQTGKTSVAEFILYCLGGSAHPNHPEILSAVGAALLECSLASQTTTIERGVTGKPSSFASVWEAAIGNAQDAQELRLSVEPPNDPAGLSQFILSSFGLDNIQLPVSPSKQDSDTHILSIKDVFRILWVPNEHLDSKNLLYEQSNYMIRQKLEQLIDVVFDVHDAEGAQLAARLRSATAAAREAQTHARSLRDVVSQEYPEGALSLELTSATSAQQLSRLEAELVSLDETADTSMEGDLRSALQEAENAARDTRLRVRNRRSLIDRLTALRSQYADDARKLIFLKEAERVFDPLMVTTCPACFNALDSAPRLLDGHCSLCGSAVQPTQTALTLGSTIRMADEEADNEGEEDIALDAEVTPSHAGGRSSPSSVIDAELTATNARLSELTDYLERLTTDLVLLERAADVAQDSAIEAAKAVDRITDLPAPFLAQRDDLVRRIADLRVEAQQAAAGIRLWERVASAEEVADRLTGKASQMRSARREARDRPDRQEVVRQLSTRFGEILGEIGYPKLADPFLDLRLMPHVRGMPYTSASSGGLVLISLAWHLAIWEIAYERRANAPGVLIVDSPQKNLGHAVADTDPDFADATLVDNFYGHLKRWLGSEGRGAQCIVVDNTPPSSVSSDVVVRYTRDRSVAPYGLITDAVD